LARQGNKKALKLWQEFGRNLGIGVVSVIHAYDPDIIILGGQISKAYKFFNKTMNQEIKSKALFKLPVIKVSKLNNAAIAAAAFVSK
jgi:glucokinase